MKKLIFTLIAFVALSISVRAQYPTDNPAHTATRWQVQHLSELKEAFGPGWISPVNDDVCWASIVDGSQAKVVNTVTVVRTIDGGVTWENSDLFSDPSNIYGISNVCGVSADVAFASVYKAGATGTEQGGKAGVWRTVDGGLNWTQCPGLFTQGSSFINNVYFFNEDEGTAFGDVRNGKFDIYWTINGGDTWTEVSAQNIGNGTAPVMVDGAIEHGSTGSFSALRTFTRENDSIIAFISNAAKYYVSRNRGRTWEVHETGLTTEKDAGFDLVISSDSVPVMNNETILVRRIKSEKSGDQTVGVTVRTAYSTNGGSSWIDGEQQGAAKNLVVNLQAVPGTKGFYIGAGALLLGAERTDVSGEGIGTGTMTYITFNRKWNFNYNFADGGIYLNGYVLYNSDGSPSDYTTIPMDFHDYEEPKDSLIFQEQYLFVAFNHQWGGWAGTYTSTNPDGSIVGGMTKYTASTYSIVPGGPTNDNYRSNKKGIEKNNGTLRVYPNPTKGLINVNSKNVIKNIEIIDMMGRVVAKKAVNDYSFEYNAANLPFGLYSIKAITNKGIETTKFSVAK